MRELIRDIGDRLSATEESVCLQRARLVTEAYRRHEGEPAPLKRARAFAHLLRHMELDLESNPVFAGNTSSRPRAWMLVPEHGFAIDAQIALENPGLEGFLEGRIPAELRAFWAGRSFGGPGGIGHLAVEMQRVVHEGLEAILAETRAGAEPDPERSATRQAMGISLQAVIDWAERYAEAAEAAACATADPLRRAAHLRVAAACRWVPARPARTLFEGLQAIALVHLAVALEGHGLSVSIGLPDRVLAPFLNDGFDPEEATNLVSAFLLKIAANSFQGRGSKTQAITVGGVDHRGRDCCNGLTLCFLDAFERVRVGDPHLFLRWDERIDPRVKQRAAELLASGLSMPLLVNDAPTAGGFLAAGVVPEDAWEYCVIGCNELGIPGRSAESATATSGTILYPELLNQVLAAGPREGEAPAEPSCADARGSAGASPSPGHPADIPPGMAPLLAALEEHMLCRATEMRRNGEAHRKRMAAQVPTPFTSALMRGCVRRGQDLLVGMEYHLPGVYERGLTNAANALAAIEQVVFREGSLTLPELARAMRDDFSDARGRERLRAAPRWGNDDERADRWARELVRMRERVLDAVDAQYGGRRHLVCHVVRSLHHLDGRRIGASPDGRHAGAPLADSIGAETGTAHAGPTGILNSVLKLDAARFYRGGYNLNLTLPARDAAPETVLALAEGFFGQGGQELQVHCLDAAVLRDAQAHPERHGDLIVRVAGFCARFIDLAPLEQEELIARAEEAVR